MDQKLYLAQFTILSMCKSLPVRLVLASVAMTISAMLLIGAFLRQWAAGAGGLVSDPMQLAWVAALYFVGFLFLGIGKMIAYCSKEHGSAEKSGKKKR